MGVKVTDTLAAALLGEQHRDFVVANDLFTGTQTCGDGLLDVREPYTATTDTLTLFLPPTASDGPPPADSAGPCGLVFVYTKQ